MGPFARQAVITLAAVAATVAVGALVGCSRRERPANQSTPTTPDAALEQLRAGNVRYVSSQRTLSVDTAHDAETRRELANGQHPFAVVVCCSDSRLCPECIFDQGPGQLFDVRNAGNVVDDDVMASCEYAVEHLHVPLILVLGHKGCGAIAAVYSAGESPLPDHLRALQEHMAGIHAKFMESHQLQDADALDRLAAENSHEQAKTLLNESEPVRSAVNAGKCRLVYGLYDMATGEVQVIDAG